MNATFLVAQVTPQLHFNILSLNFQVFRIFLATKVVVNHYGRGEEEGLKWRGRELFWRT